MGSPLAGATRGGSGACVGRRPSKKLVRKEAHGVCLRKGGRVRTRDTEKTCRKLIGWVRRGFRESKQKNSTYGVILFRYKRWCSRNLGAHDDGLTTRLVSSSNLRRCPSVLNLKMRQITPVFFFCFPSHLSSTQYYIYLPPSRNSDPESHGSTLLPSPPRCVSVGFYRNKG